MQYLTIFQLGDFESAMSFTTKKDAIAYIQSCATAAKSKALENQADSSYLIEVKASDGKTHELKAQLKPVDTQVQYELSGEKNGHAIATNYYATRAEIVKQAGNLLDELGYDASDEENYAGKWSIDNPAQNLTLSLNAHLVVMGSEGENVVATYDSTDMVEFCKHFDTSLASVNQANKVATDESLKAGRKKGIFNLCLGLGITVIGALMSVASYNHAKAGETYTVYTGLIVIGIIDAICGLYYIINPKATLPKDKKK